MNNPIFCALDAADYESALAIARAVGPAVGGMKLGWEFFAANGPAGVRSLAAEARAPIFLDLKLHDIPNTVGKAVRALGDTPYDILTVHAGGGAEMMRAAKAEARPEAKVVGVTVLTSLDASDLARMGVAGKADAQVQRLAALAREAGLDGVVCSPLEVRALRAAWPDAFLVVPGIRPAGAEVGDQKRVMTPPEAVAAGADVIVVGRPITAAADPGVAARAIAASLA